MGKKEDDHNRGQEDGAKADVFDQFAQFINPFSSEHYDKGFRHGVDTTLEKDPISEFIFSGWSDKPKTEESREEVTSNDSQYDDNYDDDDGYSPAYSFQDAPEETEPEPKPEPIVHTNYSKSGFSFTIREDIYSFDTEEEKEKYLKDEARREEILNEMLGVDVADKERDQKREHLARQVKRIKSGGVLSKVIGVASILLTEDTE